MRTSKIFIVLLTILLVIECSLAVWSILTHQWWGLVFITFLIFAVMMLIDREVRKLHGELPSRDEPSSPHTA